MAKMRGRNKEQYNPTISVIIINVNVLNFLIKRLK